MPETSDLRGVLRAFWCVVTPTVTNDVSSKGRSSVRHSRQPKHYLVATIALAAWSLSILPVGLSAHSASAVATSASAAASNLSSIRIDNFGKVNDSFFRGAQPEARDIRALAGIGIKTVIDLTKDGRADEPGFVKAMGMNFVRIPMTTDERPSD